MSELIAYLDQSTGKPGHVRPLHPRACPAREAWIPLSRCTCHLRLIMPELNSEETPAALRTYTWDGAHYRYTQGRIGQLAWEAFGYAWRRGAVHLSSVGLGYEHPSDERVRRLGNLIMGDAAPGTCPCSAGKDCTK